MNIASLLQARENRTLKRTIRKNKSVLSVVCRKIVRRKSASFEFSQHIIENSSLLECRCLSGSSLLEGICDLRFHLHIQDIQDFNEDLELLNLKATRSSKPSETTYKTTERQVPEDRDSV
jgi:hypothetical protein